MQASAKLFITRLTWLVQYTYTTGVLQHIFLYQFVYLIKTTTASRNTVVVSVYTVWCTRSRLYCIVNVGSSQRIAYTDEH